MKNLKITFGIDGVTIVSEEFGTEKEFDKAIQTGNLFPIVDKDRIKRQLRVSHSAPIGNHSFQFHVQEMDPKSPNVLLRTGEGIISFS